MKYSVKTTNGRKSVETEIRTKKKVTNRKQ